MIDFISPPDMITKIIGSDEQIFITTPPPHPPGQSLQVDAGVVKGLNQPAAILMQQQSGASKGSFCCLNRQIGRVYRALWRATYIT